MKVIRCCQSPGFICHLPRERAGPGQGEARPATPWSRKVAVDSATGLPTSRPTRLCDFFQTKMSQLNFGDTGQCQ